MKTNFAIPNIVNYVKADAGYYLLDELIEEDGTISAFRHCIIAWAIDEDLTNKVVVSRPVTLEGM
ncbi:MAG: hypothetical protein Q8Q81_07115, partial [Oxalobacteraceae bacterium]|nr:hypothetical protein [Oxalobacteraceae bacterium]